MSENAMPTELDSNTGTQDLDLDKLGRERPAIFTSRWSELGFCSAILGSMLMSEYFVGGFHIILPELAIALDIPPAARTWPASVFSLVAGSVLLPMGRLGDIYGSYFVFNFGLIWVSIWCLIAGFSRNYIMLIVCRALAGMGTSAFIVGGVMLLGKIYRPGPRKNLVFAMYGAIAPIGFFTGIFFGGVSSQSLSWRWYFWLGSIILALVSVIGLLAIPRDYRDDRPQNDDMDWRGVATIVPGLLLVVYAITDSSNASNGWSNTRIIVTMILGVAFLVAAYVVETRFSVHPLVPGDIFSPRYMKRLIVALFLLYGTFGLFLFYSSFYIQLILGVAPLLTAVWYIPMVVGGLVIGAVGGFTLHLLPGQMLLCISGIGNLVSVLLFAIMPQNPSYWAFMFPSMVCATIGIDITCTVSNVFITNSLPSHRQGLAGALISSLLFLGIGFWQGIADIVVEHTASLGLKQSYKAAFWLAVGLSGCSFALFTIIKVPSAKSQLTVEETLQRTRNRIRASS